MKRVSCVALLSFALIDQNFVRKVNFDMGMREDAYSS